MGTLLSELASREILPGTAVKRLREYIKRKNPALSPVQRAGVFADAVNRIIESKLPELPSGRMSQFRSYLYGGAAKKKVFSIDCSDIFKSSLRMRINDDTFIKGLGVWLERMLQAPVSEEKVSQYVHNANRLLDQFPGMDIEKVVESVEASVGDIRPQKRIMSVFRIISSPAVISGVTCCAAAGTEAAVSGQEAPDSGQQAPNSGQKAAVIGQQAPDCGSVAPISEQEAPISEQEAPGREQKAACEWQVVRQSGKASLGLKDATRGGIKHKRALAAGLAAAAVLCIYFSALYINVVRNGGPAGSGITVPDEGIPAGSAVSADGADGRGNGADPKKGDVSSGTPIRMKATAYDLSIESCGKGRDHPEYGITKTGTRAKAGRTVAVDPEVIPLGSYVRITFPEEYSHMDGIYVAEDTGRLITGNCIDIFFGEDEPGSSEINKKALEFGVQYVDVVIIDEEHASE